MQEGSARVRQRLDRELAAVARREERLDRLYQQLDRETR
jgi:hypothetical protein